MLFQLLNRHFVFFAGLGFDLNFVAGEGVNELNRTGDQQQPVDPKLFAEQPVVAAVAVGGVADDRMSKVVAVTTDLMTPSGSGHEPCFAVAACRVLTGGKWNLPLSVRGKRCACRLGGFACVGLGVAYRVQLFAKRSVPDAFGWQVAADNRTVGLFDLVS